MDWKPIVGIVSGSIAIIAGIVFAAYVRQLSKSGVEIDAEKRKKLIKMIVLVDILAIVSSVFLFISRYNKVYG
jgi:F0F1-type ATP synthase membrane subunit c/vacuolar-type H+-ATPase subunit K